MLYTSSGQIIAPDRVGGVSHPGRAGEPWTEVLYGVVTVPFSCSFVLRGQNSTVVTENSVPDLCSNIKEVTF
jgi:hypothetical protein